MTWLMNLVGALLVLIAIRDIFHTLWHPHGFGSLGRVVFRLVWKVFRLGPPSELPGPVGLLAVVGTWTVLVVAGWTLVYLPHMPEQFYLSSSLQPAQSDDLVASVYLSLVTVATLGFGDIVPAHPLLRLTVPLQALIGFGLLTAAVSWVLQVYPALTRRRALAKRLSIMAATDTRTFVREGDARVVTQTLQSLLDDLVMVRMDLVQYGETYFFREQDPDVSLAANLPYALALVTEGSRADSPEVRHVAAMLGRIVDSTARTLEQFVAGADGTDQTLTAFAVDHRQEPVDA